MTPPSYATCPHCGEKYDASGRCTSPANQKRDRRWWAEEHLSGKCLAESAPAEQTGPTPEQRFNALKDRLSAATGSPGMTAFHGGKIHMTLAEWERLVGSIEEAQRELRSRERLLFEERQVSANVQTMLDEACRLCASVEYRVPGRYETWDAYHEGRSAFADKVEQILSSNPPRATTSERVGTALNRAADEVLAVARDEGDELLRDAINLVVNAGLHFLEHPDASLEDVVRANYTEDVADELLDSLR